LKPITRRLCAVLLTIATSCCTNNLANKHQSFKAKPKARYIGPKSNAKAKHSLAKAKHKAKYSLSRGKHKAKHLNISRPLYHLQTRSSATVERARDAEMAIHGHSSSSVVVPIDAAYMTSYISSK